MTRYDTATLGLGDLVAAGIVGGDEASIDALRKVDARFAVAVTPTMLAAMAPGAAGDPIAAQFLPTARELDIRPGELADPIGDAVHSPVTGVVHRYPDRVLLKLTAACPVYCRFCFRREMIGPGHAPAAVLSDADLVRALAYIRVHPEIGEVIVTGGDPLVLSARRIRQVATALGAIAHLEIVRWHTRVPVVAPGRIGADMIDALKASGGTVVVAVHANHPREFSDPARAALARLADAGIMLLSQSVLLKGVNDDAEVLADLMRSFVACRVKPYYLHQLDLAPGTSHFRVQITSGLALVRALRGRLSGLCQPTYVLDLPGGYGKVPLETAIASPTEPGVFTVTDFRGQAHVYRDPAAS